MLRPNILIGLCILYGTVLTEHTVSHGELHHYNSSVTDHASRVRRFGFTVIDEIRRNFCHSFCTSADTMPYLFNVLCAAKCPELYLPHRTTTESTTTNTTLSTPAVTNSTSQPVQGSNSTSQPVQGSNSTSQPVQGSNSTSQPGSSSSTGSSTVSSSTVTTMTT
ncbi:PREDICTED: uncharacterized protein LOC108780649 [Cyphomyrmex costatus]|uniref:uncharacterized protein LOC108780649 n=1 Tax=Cyphomyrmex costatus TaxID=456900 RepID=UPI0008521FEB|nr:PREDICTED: uncharacterized protein LOC108780649 [Cyphomyrmex costatus]